MGVLHALSSAAQSARVFFTKNQAKICLITGITAMAGAAVYACVKTQKMEKILDDHLEELDQIHAEETQNDDVNGANHNELALRKTRLYLSTGAKIVSNFAGPILMFAAGAGLVTHGFAVINEKFVVANGLYMAERQINDELRARIRERDGDNALQEIEHGAYKGSEDAEKPGEVVKKEPILGPFTVTIDENNPHWQFEDIHDTIPSLQMTMQHLYALIEGWENKLHGFGDSKKKIRIFWNDFLKDIKAESKPFVRAGNTYGVMYDPDDICSDQHIDVGCYPRKLENGHYEVDMVFRNMRNIIDDPSLEEF